MDIETLDDHADLYQAGMTSHASVNVMIALEDTFDVEFLDSMLKRSVFESVASIAAALEEVRRRRPYERRRDRRRRRACWRGTPHRGRGRRRRTPTMSIARPAFPSRRSTHCARRGRCRLSCPTELGGAGASFEAVAAACFELGRHCGATAMVFAMHQIQVACIARHLDGSPWFEDYLREVVEEQRLIASITSEVGTGGDMGKSVAAVSEPVDGARELREAGADRLLRRPTPTPS